MTKEAAALPARHDEVVFQDGPRAKSGLTSYAVLEGSDVSQ